MFTKQLEFIRILHQIRSPFLDHFIRVFDYFDRQEFLFILIPLIWLGISWQFGIKIYYLLTVNHLVNSGLKHLFALPRPFHMDPTMGVIKVSGFGFPSGAAQTTILLSGLLLIYWKSRWKWIVAPAYILLISFSRIYLGVHFPMDILGGWIVGFLLLGLYLLLCPKIERFFQKRSPLSALLINQALLLVLLFVWPSSKIISICATGMGLGLGVFINRVSNRYVSAPKTKLEFIIRVSIGIIGIFLIHGLLSPHSFVFLFSQFFTIGLWISFFTFYFCSKFLWAKEH